MIHMHVIIHVRCSETGFYDEVANFSSSRRREIERKKERHVTMEEAREMTC